MRSTGGWLLVLVCVSLSGCLSEDPARPVNWLDRFRAPRSILGRDGVLIDMVLLELPLGDHFLNEEL